MSAATFEEVRSASETLSMVEDDFSAIRAHATIEMHMKECRERQAEIRSSMASIHGRLDTIQKDFSERLNGLRQDFSERMEALMKDASERAIRIEEKDAQLNSRMWTATGGLILILLAALGFFISKHFT